MSLRDTILGDPSMPLFSPFPLRGQWKLYTKWWVTTHQFGNNWPRTSFFVTYIWSSLSGFPLYKVSSNTVSALFLLYWRQNLLTFSPVSIFSLKIPFYSLIMYQPNHSSSWSSACGVSKIFINLTQYLLWYLLKYLLKFPPLWTFRLCHVQFMVDTILYMHTPQSLKPIIPLWRVCR